jgi:hypothetical protein
MLFTTALALSLVTMLREHDSRMAVAPLQSNYLLQHVQLSPQAYWQDLDKKAFQGYKTNPFVDDCGTSIWRSWQEEVEIAERDVRAWESKVRGQQAAMMLVKDFSDESEFRYVWYRNRLFHSADCLAEAQKNAAREKSKRK